MKNITLFLIFICFTSVYTQAQSGKLYKWKDAEGNIYFSDKVPPKDSALEHNILDRKWRTIEIKDAEKSPEQIAIVEKIKALQVTKKKNLTDQQKQDTLLLKLFQTEEDIEKILESKTSMLKSHIKVTELQTQKITEQLIGEQKKAATFDRNGKKIPEKTLKKINVLKSVLDDNKQDTRTLKLQVTNLIAQAKTDKARFNILKQYKYSPHLKIYSTGRPSLQLGELDCITPGCEVVWNNATNYIKTKTNAKIIFESLNLLLTQPPISDESMSLSLTAIKSEHKSSVVLDIQCQNNLGGRNTCQGSEVSELIAEFNGLLKP